MPSLAEYYFRTWVNAILHLQKASAEIGLSSLRRMSGDPTEQTAQKASTALGGKKSSTKPQQDTIDERIRQRAYDIWIQEGRPQGRDKENWERAQVEIEGDRALSETPPMTGPFENLR